MNDVRSRRLIEVRRLIEKIRKVHFSAFSPKRVFPIQLITEHFPHCQFDMIEHVKEENCEDANNAKFAARIVTGSRKFDHIKPSLKELDWISVNKKLRLRDSSWLLNVFGG